uniref:POU domain protein n=1 Tax=Malacoceros fuliginosus TaxID=271776 RepID=A0A7G9UKY7_MALFL|nr:POU domain class 4 transcription factor [Malacoceros fuliginosus]
MQTLQHAAMSSSMQSAYPGIYHPHQYSKTQQWMDRSNTGGNFHGGNLFGSLDDNLLARAEALADISKNGSSPPGGPLVKPDSLYGGGGVPTGHHDPMSAAVGQHQPRSSQMSAAAALHGFGPGESMLDQLSGMSMPLTGITPDHSCSTSMSHTGQMYSPVYSHPMTSMPHHQAAAMGGQPLQTPMAHHPHAPGGGHHDLDCDPRELEAFAEHFKQRRIKLGVTQADVGNALGKLKIPGVGSLSQSTICRFESLTLSHNNMIALKPVLQAWLEEAEKAAREASQKIDGVYAANDKKRKRTSIAAPEKRSLEAYFAIQPRPSGEKIAQIAEKLDLKKNVVRVWFCNQRQKQKRMKFSATGMQGPHTPHPPH